jgi:hypothetical protein
MRYHHHHHHLQIQTFTIVIIIIVIHQEHSFIHLATPSEEILVTSPSLRVLKLGRSQGTNEDLIELNQLSITCVIVLGLGLKKLFDQVQVRFEGKRTGSEIFAD